MAFRLKREHRLMSLRVQSEFWTGNPLVNLNFEYGGVLQDQWSISALDLNPESEPSIGLKAKLPSKIVKPALTVCLRSCSLKSRSAQYSLFAPGPQECG